MSSSQFQAINQQDSPSGPSNSGVPSEDTRSTATGEYPQPGTSESFRFRAQLRQEVEEFQQQQQQQQQQQRQQQQEQVRLRTVEQTRQAVQQPRPQQEPQRDRNPWLQLVKIIFENYFLESAALVLLIAIFWFAPTICQYVTERWASAQMYQDWCKGERTVGYPLTRTCSLIVDRQLPLPPGMGPSLREMRAREAEDLLNPPADGFVRPWNREQVAGTVVAPGDTAWDIWKSRTDGERAWFQRAMYYTFIRGPVGNGISWMFFGLYLLVLSIEETAETGRKWFQFAFILYQFQSTRNSTLIFALRNVTLLMDWALYLRRCGVQAPSLEALCTLPVFFALGWMNEYSITTQIIGGVISGLAPPDVYSHQFLYFIQFLFHLGWQN